MIVNRKQTGLGMWPVIFIIVLVCTALSIGYINLSSNHNNDSLQPSSGGNAATLLPQAKSLSPALALTDFSGQPFTLDQFKNHWSLLFFGYTSCQDVCPAQMTLLNKLVNHPEINNKPQVLLISVDPERDTPEHLKKYLHTFNSNFIGIISNNKTELERFSKELGIYYEYVETLKGISQDPAAQHKEEKAGYEINHTASLILINPDGQYTALFTAPYVIDDMVKAYNDITQ